MRTSGAATRCGGHSGAAERRRAARRWHRVGRSRSVARAASGWFDADDGHASTGGRGVADRGDGHAASHDHGDSFAGDRVRADRAGVGERRARRRAHLLGQHRQQHDRLRDGRRERWRPTEHDRRDDLETRWRRARPERRPDLLGQLRRLDDRLGRARWIGRRHAEHHRHHRQGPFCADRRPGRGSALLDQRQRQQRDRLRV